MANETTIKRRIIEQVKAMSENELEEFYDLLMNFINKNIDLEEPIKLTDEQEQMLKMGREDIQAGRYMTQEELDQKDASWLNEL